MKKILMMCAVVGLIVTGGAVWAGEDCGRGGLGRHGDGRKGFDHEPGCVQWVLHNKDKAKELGVTDDQIGQIQEAMRQSETQEIKDRADLEIAQLELRRLMDDNKPTVEAVDKSIDAIGGLEAQLQKDRMHRMLKGREILGDETFAKIRDFMEDRWRKQMTDSDRDGRGGRHAMGQGEDWPTPRAAPVPPPEEKNEKDE